jgi:hypothetical protein
MEELIEKQITVLIPKSQEKEFDSIIKGYNRYTFDQYTKEFGKEYNFLTLQITSTPVKNENSD